MEEEIIIPEEETFDYNKLRYILDKNGYVCHASLGGLIVCDLGECTEYKGEIPEGYETIEAWYEAEIDKLNAWKIVEDNLVYDENKYNELLAIYEVEAEENATATHGWVRSQLGVESSIINDEFSKNVTGSSLVKIEDSGEYEIPNITLSSSSNESVNVISSNKNLLGIDAVTKTVSGIIITVNADGSITLNGTSTAEIEFDLKGTSTSLEMLFLIKNGLEYVISGLADNVSLSLYSYDGTNRTLVGNYGNGVINFSNSEIVTQSTLKIASGKTFESVTISPQLEIGNIASPFIKHIENRTAIAIEGGVGVSSNELQSYEPITILMTDKEVNISVDYFRHKYLENKFTEIEKTNDEIKLSVESMSEDLQPIGDAEGLGELSLPDSAGEDLLEFIVEGKSEQDGTPTSTAPIETKNISGIENLFKVDISDGLLDGITYEVDSDGIITINGTANGMYNTDIVIGEATLPAGTYFIDGAPLDSSENTFDLRYRPTKGSWTGYVKINKNGYSFTTDTEITCDLVITVTKGVTVSNKIYKPMIVKGSKKKYFVPYGSNYLVEKVVGKNKFNKSEKPIFQVNTSYQELETGIRVTLNSTTQYRSMGIPINDFKRLLGKTLTLSGNMVASANNVPSLRMFWVADSLATVGNVLCMLNESGEVTFTMPTEVPDTATKLVLLLYANVDGSGQIGDYVDYTNIQLEINSKKTKYEEYKEAISLIDLKGNELCSIGNVKDELIIKNGKALLNRKIGKIILNGSENWTRMTTGNGKYRYVTDVLADLVLPIMSASGIPNLYCDHYITGSANDTYAEIECMTINVTNLVVFDTRYNTMDNTNFKNWLSNNPITVYYELATPRTIDLGEVSIETVQSDCTLTLEEELDTNLYAKYIRNTPYNEAYITRSEAKAEIKVAKDEINLEVSKKVDGKDVVSTINQSAEQITLKGNRVVIESDKFNLNADGTIEATGGTIGGFDISDNQLSCEITPRNSYSENDIEKLKDYLEGTITLTNEEKIKYDVNEDGVLNSQDIALMRAFIMNNITIETPGSFELNTEVSKIQEMIVGKNGNGETTLSIGIDRVMSKLVAGTSGNFDSISAGNLYCGRDTFETEANNTINYEILFSTPFPSAPSVVLTQVTSAPNNSRKVSVGNITTEKFDIFVYDTSNSSITVCWMAMSN